MNWPGAGITIHLSFVMQDKLGDATLLLELSRTYPNITYTDAPKKTPFQFWLSLSRVRSLLGGLRPVSRSRNSRRRRS